MSTTTEKEIDYQAYMRENPPDLSNIIRGPEAREKRREAAMERMSRKRQFEGNTRQPAQKEAGFINAATEKEIDYQAYMRENPPDLSNIIRGPEAREKRREAALKRILQDKQSEDHDTQ